jgi:hypothetical protein
MTRGTSSSSDGLFTISGASRIHTLVVRAFVRAVCCDCLFKFESKSVQVFGRPGEHLSFSIGDKLAQQNTLGRVRSDFI